MAAVHDIDDELRNCSNHDFIYSGLRSMPTRLRTGTLPFVNLPYERDGFFTIGIILQNPTKATASRPDSAIGIAPDDEMTSGIERTELARSLSRSFARRDGFDLGLVQDDVIVASRCVVTSMV